MTITTPLLFVICHLVARIDIIAYLCTKFDDFRFSRSIDMIRAPKIVMGHKLTMPLLRIVCRPQAMTCTFNLYIKFIIFAITLYEDA